MNGVNVCVFIEIRVGLINSNNNKVLVIEVFFREIVNIN